MNFQNLSDKIIFASKALLKRAYYPQGEDKLNNRTGEDPNSADAKKATTKIYFADQKLLNLWENEISGQLSDGAWENTPKTEWLWRDSVVLKGSKNEIVIDSSVRIGKQNYGWKQLLDIPEIKQRMIVGNGFANEGELKRALSIMTTMIKQPRVDSSIYKEKQNQENLEKEQAAARIDEFIKDKPEWKKSQYDWQSPLYKPEGKSAMQLELKQVGENTITIKETYDGKIGGKYGLSFDKADYPKVMDAIKQIAQLAK